MAKSVKYEFCVKDGVPIFLLNPRSIVVEHDIVTWNIRGYMIGFHYFLELKTGESITKTVVLPLCLANQASRLNCMALVRTTIDPADGRFNSKLAEFIIATTDGALAFKVQCSLAALSMCLVMLELFPESYLHCWKSRHCPFCESQKRNNGDEGRNMETGKAPHSRAGRETL